MTTPKVVVVGSYNTDLLLRLSQLPFPGETVLAHQLMQTHGGKGSNQAVAAARLGAEVTLIARIGADSFGDAALEFWQGEGIDTRFVVRDPHLPTGLAPILVDHDGENMIAVAMGANANLSASDLDAAYTAITRADLLITQLEIDHRAATYAMQLGKRARIMTILNPAPATDVTLDMLVHADILTPNEIELEQLYGSESLYIDEVADYLLTSEQQTVVVTLAEQGARWIKRSGTAAIPTIPVDAIDSTGAGDAFTAALGVALAEGKALEEAIMFANACGALCVTRAGAAVSMPHRHEVEALLADS